MTTNNTDFIFSDRAEGFDNHINSSIPGFVELNNICVGLSQYFITSNSNVYDIGCSSGRLLNHIINTNKSNNVNYFGVDIKRFDEIDDSKFEFIKIDVLDSNLEINNASFISSMFTIQFIEREHRYSVLRKIHDALNKNGAFFISEKTYSDHPRLQDMMTSLYYEFKEKTFTCEDILSKEKTLRGMMKIIGNYELESELKYLFSHVQSVWRNYNFVGYICMK